MKHALAIAFALAGCLSVPDEAPVECKTDSDCDTANGEVCAENVCYGNPPPGPFAALITPPTERKNELVSHEIQLESLPTDGYFGDLELDEAVTFSGQIVCPIECANNEMFGASIVVSRPSIFVGGPAFRQAFSTDPRTGNFKLVLPRVNPDEPLYTMTVVPDNRDENTLNTMASLVPPLRTTLSLDSNQTAKSVDLGGVSPPIVISGEIVDVLDNPAANYRVVALGRWDSTSPVSEVSTVDFIRETGGNTFSLRLSEGIQGKIEIVAKPFGTPLHQPTLRIANVLPQAATGMRMVIPNVGSPTTIQVAVQGTGTGGEVTGVMGAHVTIRGDVLAPPASPATFVAEADTNVAGMVTLQVPSGAFDGSYKVSVVPPAGSPSGMVFEQAVVSTDTVLKLPDRLAIVGKVVDASGNPLEGVQVTAVPSLRFQWSLDAAQTFITSIPSPTAVTPDTGEFVLFVDPVVLDDGEIDVWGYYDLVFAPTETTNAPTWTVFEVEIPRDTTQSQVALTPTVLPDAAHIRGRIVDPFGDIVEDAELKLFRVEDPDAFSDFCRNLSNAPVSCPIPAFQLGRGVTDVDGIARLTLPR